MKKIKFNTPYLTGHEFNYIKKASTSLLSGNGHYTNQCEIELSKIVNLDKVLLTNSCTSSLEIAAHLTNMKPGDEILIPSYTFVSTANAFLLRGIVPRFVDIDHNTLNIDLSQIEKYINKKTKAILPVHYAGTSCDMDKAKQIAADYSLYLIEDAAQAIGSKYKDQHLGTIGDFGTISFHATKNINCGEGGAILINDSENFERAEIIREKGTNRSKFLQGKVDKYTWVDIGSSYVVSELNSAYLLAQLENIEDITSERIKVWNKYHTGLNDLENEGFLKRPSIPKYNTHNAHIYYILTKDLNERNKLIKFLAENDIEASFHYIPLHQSNFIKKFIHEKISLPNSESISERILRLPLWPKMNNEVEIVINAINKFYKNK